MDLQEYQARQARSFYANLREATAPVFFRWQDPENPMPQIGGEPRGVSGYPFQGDNATQLAMASKAQGFQSPYWMTYEQAKACGGTVRRGEVGTKILSWMGGKDGKPYEPILMTVFNADQISNLDIPRTVGLTPQQQATRQAGLDALIPPRKKTPTPQQYNERLAQVLAERFPAGETPEQQAQATLRRELAMLTAQARLGLPRQLDPKMADDLAPYVEKRPNWRELESAIDEANKAVKELGVEALVYDKLDRNQVAAEVKPAALPKTPRTRAKAVEKGKAKDSEIPF
ncbi:ArdC family protein [Luteimonas sp. MC1750]|uniref:ArdC-like ssDNA-binding domain-containing protein n=1 Tax=Luteimonas sp. MC1750 TaxID=2799326 RepID=UPI0018F06035|nr:ArdC family protein [Luteimonas sp. MC1750]MBJ6984005.1 DUF1738 domain-containing protein [Luteimonas sp. MC1750]QQO06817.1 DUF1738 domain-containing protein [Luteimonas sp. MC1750]